MDRETEGKMKFKKEAITQLIIVVLALCMLTPGYAQTKKEQSILFPGVIEQISGDLRFIVVNETRISLSSETQVKDEKGKGLSLSDLKPLTFITIEVIKNANGFLAKQIVVKSSKR